MDSSTLRIWILLVGAMFIAGIYGWDKFKERKGRRHERIEPRVGGAASDDWEIIPTLTERHLTGGQGATVPAGGRHTDPEVAPKRVKELIVSLSVFAPRGRQFRGEELARALNQAGMVYGDMHIYHAPADLELTDGPTLFSLANVLEPGTLEPERLRLLETPGVVLFAQLPGPVNGMETYEHMRATAGFLARELDGVVCDEARRPLTAEKSQQTCALILSEIGNTVRKPDF